MRAIIPSAGLGTRMGMRPDQSKEMLLDNTGRPIIHYSLALCAKYNLTPLVILRKEKTDLIDYCKEQNIETFIIEPKREWPETILASEAHWEQYNIMILPDTRFSDDKVIQYMKNDLENGCQSSIALHRVEDSSKWCVINRHEIIEKPNYNEKAWAMGLLAFNDFEGEDLFGALSKRNNYYELFRSNYQYLDSFKDITRTGIVE